MELLGPLIFFALAAFGAWNWRRSGLRVPLFIHLLALLGVALGAWMTWLDTTVDEFSWRRAVFQVVVMPYVVYIAFYAYSGRLRTRLVAERTKDDQAAS